MSTLPGSPDPGGPQAASSPSTPTPRRDHGAHVLHAAAVAAAGRCRADKSRCASSTARARRARRSGLGRVHRRRLPRDRARERRRPHDYADPDSLRAGQARQGTPPRSRWAPSNLVQATSDEHAGRRRARDRRPRLLDSSSTIRLVPHHAGHGADGADRRPRPFAGRHHHDEHDPSPADATPGSFPSTRRRRPAGRLPEEVSA